ncbi:MAG TPA: sulfurtransferase [Methylomirabilota bacterium]|nr:sulfurtransferase [Methylomirabilota bacterium]
MLDPLPDQGYNPPMGAVRDSLLAETDWLAAHVDDPAVRIVDIRGTIKPPTAPRPWYAASREAYEAAHIPGAVFVDWLQDIVDVSAPVKMTVAQADQFAALMGRLGVGDEHTVIAYDDNGHIAPRLWWALNYYGHPAVRVLDGGWTKWVAEGRPVTAAVPRHPPARFTARVRPEWRAAADEVRARLEDPATVVVDCRSPVEYRGEIGRGDRAVGRIPGSVNLSVGRLMEGEHKVWRREPELRALFEEAGITPDRDVITYCNAGVSASIGLFGAKLLGYPRARNFAGSWYEWEQDPRNPVQTG